LLPQQPASPLDHILCPKNSLVPDPQPGLDSDGRHWEYTIKLTCGHIACNADSANKRREHVQKKLSGKHRQVAPPLWQRRGDTFPRPEAGFVLKPQT